MVSMTDGAGETVRFPRLCRAVRGLVLIGFPASLASPGITIPMALVGLIGLYLWSKRGEMPRDLVAPGRVALGLYLTVLLVDMVNGRPLLSLATTGVNYLPLIAIVPFAMAVRESDLPWAWVDTAIKATIVLAALSSVIQFMAGDRRPDGLNLNAIPYGLVLLFWMMLLLSRFLVHRDRIALAVALLATVPIVLTSSKNVFGCMVLGVTLIVLQRLIAARDWKGALPAFVILVIAAAIGSVTFLRERVEDLVVGFGHFLQTGEAGLRSFDNRYRIAEAAQEAFRESPLIGHGLHESLGVVMEFAGPATGRFARLGHLHGDYMTHAVAFGIIGLVFLAVFLGFVIWVARRSGNPVFQAFGPGFAAAVAFYMGFDIVFNMEPLSGPVAVIVGLLLAYGPKRDA